MEKIIYHGSDHVIVKPEYGHGKPYNDYGLGFYCTENPNMAKEWGAGIDHNGYANRYRIECEGLQILNLNSSDYTMLHWSKDKEYDRLGLKDNYTEFLGNKVICYDIPVRPGRNVAIIVECAAVNNRAKKMGYNAAQVLYERVTANMKGGN